VIAGLLLALVGASDGVPQISPGASWAGFRGTGSGHTAAQDLPRNWSEPAWSTSTPGYGQSAPVVWGERVFVTSIEGANKEQLYVSCLRLSDGLTLWVRSFAASMQTENSAMVSRAAPTPVVSEQNVFAFFESGDLLCLQHDGTLVWRNDFFERFGPFEGNHGIGSSPVLADGVLAVLMDHAGPSHLIGLDPATGKDRWLVEREPRVSWSTPVVAATGRGTELIVSSNGTVESFALASGERNWLVEGVEGNTVPSPTFMDGRVVVGCSKGTGLRLIEPGNAGDARLVWEGDGLAPSGFGSPLALSDAILLLNKAGVLSSVALATGELQWEERLSSGGTWASPIFDGEHVWYFGKDGLTSVVQWTPAGPEEVAVNELELEGGVHGVAAVDGAFVLRSPDRVVCVRAPAEAAQVQEGDQD